MVIKSTLESRNLGQSSGAKPEGSGGKGHVEVTAEQQCNAVDH